MGWPEGTRLKMDWLSLETQVRLISGLIVFVAGYTFWMGQLEICGLPGNYTNPVLALELVTKGEHIDQINRSEKEVDGKRVTANAFLSTQLRKDSGFIILYVLLFSVVALLLMRLTSAPWKGIALSGIICAVVGGILDFVENSGMRKALALTQGGATNDLAKIIRYPSLAKWALVFFCLLLIGISFLWGQTRVGVCACGCGVLLFLSGVVGLFGVIFNLYKPQFNPLFPGAVGLQALGFSWMAVVFFFFPSKLVASFSS